MSDMLGNRRIFPALTALAVGTIVVVVSYLLTHYTQPAAEQQGLYLFLFAYNPILDNYTLAENTVPLYEKIDQITGIKRPTFEQIHYTISKEGVYNYTNRPIDNYEFVKIVVSDSVRNPTDGQALTEQDISSVARFRYQSLGPASLLFEQDGRVMVWDSEHYDNPNDLPPDKMARVMVFLVQAYDFDKVNQRYDEIKSLIETFKPPPVFQQMKVYIFPHRSGTDIGPNELADGIRNELGIPLATDYGFTAGASRTGIYLLDGSIILPGRVEVYIHPSVKMSNGNTLSVADIDEDFLFGNGLKVGPIALDSQASEAQSIYAIWIVIAKPDIEKTNKNVDEIYRLIQWQILRNTPIEPTT